MGFLKGFSIAMGANIIVFALSFINNKLIYLYLDEADNGLFFLIMRSSLFLALFLGDWLRLSSMNIAGKDKRLIPSLSANGFWYSIVLIVLLIIPVVVFSSLKSFTFLDIPSIYLPVVLFTGAALIARNNWQSLLLVNHRMFSYGFTFVLWAGLFLLMDVVFLIILKYGITFVLSALIIASIVSAIWAFVANLRSNGHSFRPSRKLFAQSARIGVRAWLAVLGMFIMTNIHAFSIKPMSPSEEEGWVLVAMFSVGFRIFSLFQRGSDVAGTVLYSHVVQENEQNASRMTMVVARNIMLVSILFSLAVAVSGKILILIIASSRYLDAYIPMLLMLPGIIAVNVGSVLNNYYWGRTYPVKIIAAPYVAACFGLALSYFLIPSMGVAGAAFSFSLMNLVWLFYQVFWFSRDNALKPSDVLVPKMQDIRSLSQKISHRFRVRA